MNQSFDSGFGPLGGTLAFAPANEGPGSRCHGTRDCRCGEGQSANCDSDGEYRHGALPQEASHPQTVAAIPGGHNLDTRSFTTPV